MTSGGGNASSGESRDPATMRDRADLLAISGNFEQAIALYRAVLKEQPDDSSALRKLAGALQSAGSLDEAASCYRRAIALDPSDARAHEELGKLFGARGDMRNASENLRIAVRLDPKLFAAHDALGSMLHDAGRYDEAVASLQTALALAPNDANISFRLGACLSRAKGGRMKDGLNHLRRAIELQPRHLQAHIQLGAILSEHGYRAQARQAYQAGLAFFPDDATLRLGATVAELPIVGESEAELESSRETYASKLESLARFFTDRAGHALQDAATVGTAQPMYLAYQGCDIREPQARYGAMVAGIMSRAYPNWARPPNVSPPKPDEPIRIGIVSGHFYGHSVLKIPIWGWAALLDRRRFRLFGYHTASYQDSETSRVRRSFERFTQGPLPLERWGEIIRADAPHALIFPEIGMDQMVPKLAGLRLRPLQFRQQV